MSGTLVNNSQVDLLGWAEPRERNKEAWPGGAWPGSVLAPPSPRLSSREQLALGWGQSMQRQRLGRGQWWQCVTSHQGDTWSGKAETAGPAEVELPGDLRILREENLGESSGF